MNFFTRLFSRKRPQTCCEDGVCPDPATEEELNRVSDEHRQLEARLRMLQLSAEVKSHLHRGKNARNPI